MPETRGIERSLFLMLRLDPDLGHLGPFPPKDPGDRIPANGSKIMACD